MSYIIERIWVDNSLRNYQYLVACKDSKQALVVDPIDADLCREALQRRGWQAVGIVVTHSDSDHVSGNRELAAQLAVPVYSSREQIPATTNIVSDGDRITCGTLDFVVVSTPGHCVDHVVFYHDVDEPLLIAGDLLFNAGVGRASGSNIDVLFDSIERLTPMMSVETTILPGHDVFEANLTFCEHWLPGDAAIQRQLSLIAGQSPADRPLVRLCDERIYNPFLRVHDDAFRAQLAAAGHVEAAVTPRELFAWLRRQRNRW
ncbi:MBL fold metallo-hydrolase [Gammaproteobacteria bacterium]|nr:MBL fold metallo-hydrolase [Gammaproteobacteria bacterium]